MREEELRERREWKMLVAVSKFVDEKKKVFDLKLAQYLTNSTIF